MLAALALLLAGTGRARPEVIIMFAQNGNDVVATSSGSLNLTALTLLGQTLGGPGPSVSPNGGAVVFFTPTDRADGYSGIAGPGSFGPGQLAFATTHTGPFLGIDGSGAFFGGPSLVPSIQVPHGFTGGTIQPSTDTWANTTISRLGLTPGTYKWTWGSAANGNADDLEVVIPSATTAVPEPASLTLLGIGAVGMVGYGWRRRRQQAA
jgi:hypothetical protein